MAYVLEISDSTADQLVVEVLKHSLECLRTDLARMLQVAPKQEWDVDEQRDIQEMQDMESSLVKVIRYYTPPSEWDQV